MTSSVAHKILGPLAGLTIAMVGVPADGGGVPDTGVEAAPQAATAQTRPAGTEPSSPAGSSDTAHSPGLVEEVVSRAAAVTSVQQQEVLGYWTPERMAEAAPRARLLDEVATTLPLPLPAPQAESQAAPSATSSGLRWRSGGKVVETTGRVYLTMDGSDFTCSASVVNAQNQDTVLTAGHCLKDGKGAWASNWIFVPGYDDGAEPHGRYSARDMVVSPRWSRDADDSFDFGLAVLNESDGAHVAERTGTQEIAFSDRVADRVYSFGYPSSGSYDGRHLYYCSGPTSQDQNGTAGSGMRCSMTQGSSGGPWFTDFDTDTGVGAITSVVSFKYANDSGTQYGPRLGTEAERVYETAQVL